MESPCLDEHELLLFASGGLIGEELARSEAHVDACATCRLLLAVAAEAAPGSAARRSPVLAVFSAGDLVAARYQIVGLLGAGGMGEVYEAVDTTLAERVALKTIGAVAPLDAQGVARFKAEVQTARRVTHPNVCRVFDVGFHIEPARTALGDALAVPFLTMEMLAGETLRARIAREQRLSAADALMLLGQMAAGLDAAHAAGVVHADLKSENVMLVPRAERGFRVVITDFGLARQHRTDSHESRSSAGFVGGTVGYMAPEQLQGGRPGPAGDIYALGVLMFEMLTGELPFRGSSPLAVAIATVNTTPASLRSFALAVPAAWDEVLRRSLDPEPTRRFASAIELVEALRSTAGRRPAAKWRVALAGALAVVVAAALASVRTRPVGEGRAGASSPAIEAPRSGRATPERTLAEVVNARPPAPTTLPDSPPPIPLSSASPRGRRATTRPSPDARPRKAHVVTVPESPSDDDAIDPFVDR
jgi:serine/threonine protein kinase